MNQQRLIDFLIERAVFCLVLFFILIGSLLASVDSQTLKAMSTPKRLLTQLGGYLLIVLIMGYLIDNFRMNPYALSGLGLFLGMGSIKSILWAMKIWEQSEGVTDFLAEIARLVRAFWQTYNNLKGPSGPDQKS